MRNWIIPILFLLLISLALGPWIYTACSPQSLVPNDLKKNPTYFQETIDAAIISTADARRDSTSIVVVTPLATVEDPTLQEESSIETPEPASKVTINTIPANTGIGSMKDSQSILTITPTSDSNRLLTNEGIPDTPTGLVDTEDIISELELTYQLTKDAGDGNLKDLKIYLLPEGFRIESKVTIFPGIKRNVEVQGVFVITNYKLIAKINSIFLDNANVTDQYSRTLEDRLDSSLYRLLPERFVQSFIITNGTLVVYSKVRQ